MSDLIADYALISLNAYWNKRDAANRVYPPTDWQRLDGDLGHRSDGSGFEAVAYRNTTSGEIVIAYTGTDELTDWWTNVGGVIGIPTGQMESAARFYADVFHANPTATITFTGHSLGGGLAGLMAVLFNRQAYTFDPAPYRMSANNDTRDTIRTYLQSVGLLDTELAAMLDSFHSSQPASRTGASSEPGIRGENQVWRMLVQNEAVSKWAPGSFIGTRIPAILGHASLDQSSADLHSMSLLATMVAGPGFWDAAKRMPNLIPLIFDSNIFKTNPANSTPTLLDHLLRYQDGVTGPTPGEVSGNRGMLDHFNADLGKLILLAGEYLTDNDLNRGLIAFLGRAYLKQDQGYEKELFQIAGGGLNFDTADTTDNISGDKGYSDYLKNYLSTKLGAETFGQYEGQITQLLDWYLAGKYLSAQAKDKAAFMLGAANTDNLTGSTEADLLVGLGGNDFLDGRGGDDTLIGGDGTDTYIYKLGDGADTIIDSDKKGRIQIVSADGTKTYEASVFTKNKTNPNEYLSPDEQVKLVNNGTGWQLQVGGGTHANTLRDMYSAYRPGYSAATSDPRLRWHPLFRPERPLAAALPAACLVVESGTMNPAKTSSLVKVSRGGTPSNEAWRVAA